jgi:outer membrane receptor protein involved in Fe transport
VRQSLKFSDPITRDFSRVNAYGYAGQATTHWGRRLIASLGGEVYDERIVSERLVRNPVAQTATNARPLYPDRSKYRSAGFFGQTSFEITRTLRASGGVRATSVHFKTREDSSFGIPESSQTFRDLTYHTSFAWQLNDSLGLHGVVSRGFRAPNLNDLGALGLNDLGYEIPVAETIASGALLSTDAGESAVSRGVPVRKLSAESIFN